MRRRGFLGALGAAIAGATLDPERALWVPGRKVFSVPAPAAPIQFGCQFNCPLGPLGSPLGSPDFHNRYILPAVAAIVRQIEDTKISRYILATLPMPKHSWIDGESGPMFGLESGRYLMDYNPIYNEMVGRLDVLMVPA